MNISPINNVNSAKPVFGHNNPWADSPYNTNKKVIVAVTTALGTLGGMACHILSTSCLYRYGYGWSFSLF